MGVKKRGYHHGDLRVALIDAAVQLIGEHGVKGFTLAEASRQLGVSVAAPYRHFADRDRLVAAVAVQACGIIGEAVSAAGGETPAERLAEAARAYVSAAAANRPLFVALVGVGLDKRRYPEVEEAARPVAQAFLEPARLITGAEEDAVHLTETVVAIAHGHAVLLMDASFGPGPRAAAPVAARAAHAVRAVVECLRSAGSPA
ncbi:TetR/AcrR family transcriptional regulator [Nonomuraea sp. GTA35]|uniref:TetR/AcrR family transcriptional regulator n=1 Tax=Nonomuraea sp. GTA35 TaxID=1676746 RepID=UPI0035C20EA2